MDKDPKMIDQLIFEVRKAFEDTIRPEQFIRGTCQCDECREHEETMQSFRPDELPLDKLCNPGWDPICFASNRAFAYFMPGLAKIVLENPDQYLQQFLFHIRQPERRDSFTTTQADALVKILDFLVLEETAIVERHASEDDLFNARSELEEIIERIDG